MKNYVLKEQPHSATYPWTLIDNDGVPFEPFLKTVKKMVTLGYPKNSIDQYCGHIGRFLDYMFEAAHRVESHSAEVILDVVYSYKSFLQFGKNSADPLTAEIAKSLNKKNKTSHKSLAPIEAAIKFFLLVSESQPTSVKSAPIFDNLRIRDITDLNTYERKKMLAKSMLAGVIAGGPMFKGRGASIFGRKNTGLAENFSKLAIPFDKILPFLNSLKAHRDKVYYSLLAASGCRGHEARQVRLEDIDVINRKVRLVAPASHKRGDLTEKEWRMLCWKGRACQETFLIEPFKSFFFESLLQYRREERIAVTGNDYLLQQKNGRPFFTTSRPTRSQSFRETVKKVGLSGRQYGGHSLRHSYGFYTVNYLPLPNGNIGLPLPIVKLIMGHSSLSSTEIYAKRDESIVDAAIEYANSMIFGQSGNASLNEIRIRYLQSEIDRIAEAEKRGEY